MIFFFNDTATTEIYTLSLHDALPICTTAVPGKDATPREISNETLDGLLIDLGFPSGDCGLYLGTLGDFDFIEAVNNLRRFDRRLASTGLARHESGLRLLTLPRQPARLREIGRAHV